MGTLTPKGVVLYTSSSDSKQISAIPTLRDAAVRKPRLRPFRSSLSWLSGCLDVTLPRRAAINNLAFSIKSFLLFPPRSAYESAGLFLPDCRAQTKQSGMTGNHFRNLQDFIVFYFAHYAQFFDSAHSSGFRQTIVMDTVFIFSAFHADILILSICR